MHTLGLRRLPTLPMAIMMLASALPVSYARAEPRATEFKLSNGMDVVVIPDHRAPVVTHMVWYKVGAADEPKGVSGIAHFLEHLMFKSTDKIAVGEFSKIISRLGGQDNAFTGQDVTSYHQRISKEQLGTVMEMEADRMDAPAPHPRRGRDRAPGDPRGAPLAHRQQPDGPARRADERRALPVASLRHPGHRLGARDGEALA